MMETRQAGSGAARQQAELSCSQLLDMPFDQLWGMTHREAQVDVPRLTAGMGDFARQLGDMFLLGGTGRPRAALPAAPAGGSNEYTAHTVRTLAGIYAPGVYESAATTLTQLITHAPNHPALATRRPTG